jgi:predicted metalloprotease
LQSRLDSEVVGSSRDKLREAVFEHATWLAANCNAQRAYYTGFVENWLQQAQQQGRMDVGEVQDALAGARACGHDRSTLFCSTGRYGGTPWQVSVHGRINSC